MAAKWANRGFLPCVEADAGSKLLLVLFVFLQEKTKVALPRPPEAARPNTGKPFFFRVPLGCLVPPSRPPAPERQTK